jgi:glycine cleavage system H protein
LNVPNHLHYTSSHEWLSIEGDTAILGITDYAQSELGDIVYLDLPEVGRVVTAGQSVGTIESVKTVSDIYTPVSGEIIAINEKLTSMSELVNQDPYGEGWIMKIKMDGEPQDTITAEQYTLQISE